MSCVSLASQEATNVFVNSSTCIDWAGLSLLLARRAVPCCFFVVWMLFNAILGSRKTTEKRYDIVESILSYCFFYERLYIPTFLHNQTLPPLPPPPRLPLHNDTLPLLTRVRVFWLVSSALPRLVSRCSIDSDTEQFQM
ncbi:Uncharacterized protein APZ42_027413 [Daphnia magna]|uniref:Uncharacterized protein n=1 Tax=Daphnia magna TaxID=35525 RepID=A0A164RIP4_9CRUS|nr:Uncharacterized protein APZ42_027413 [Daphnia magna]